MLLLFEVRFNNCILGSLEEALSAEKYYSDYFSTTEAETKMAKAQEPLTKRVVRKTKKAMGVKVMGKAGDNSDTEEEDVRGMYFAFLFVTFPSYFYSSSLQAPTLLPITTISSSPTLKSSTIWVDRVPCYHWTSAL